MSLNRQLKMEADEILYSFGLYSLLKKYVDDKDIFITGSYILDLMVWRDLDIYVDVKSINQDDIYDMLSDICNVFKPVWLEAKNTLHDESGCPKGYFLGFETMKVRNDLWNIDIWFTNLDYINESNKRITDITNLLTNEKRETITYLKKSLIKMGVYGKSIFSVDIYDGVLRKGIKDIETLLRLYGNVSE